MAWIESHQELRDHPKTKRVMRLLGITLPETIGHLHLLWWWTLQYYTDGRLSDVTMAEIEDAAMWQGEQGAFVGALVRAGFLEEDEDTWLVHDWYEYAEKYLDRRAANAQRMREARAVKEKTRATHVQRTSRARAGATIPNQTKPNHTEPNQNTGDTPVTPTREPRATSEPYAVYVTFCETVGAEEASLPAAFKGKQLGVAKRLLDGGYTSEQIAACVLFMRRQEWRTSPFDLADVEKTIGKWLASGAPSHEAARASPNGNGQYKTSSEKKNDALRELAERHGITAYGKQEDDTQPVLRAIVAGGDIPPRDSD